MACAYYYGSTMCNSMLSDTYHNNNNNTKAGVHLYLCTYINTELIQASLEYHPVCYLMSHPVMK